MCKTTQYAKSFVWRVNGSEDHSMPSLLCGGMVLRIKCMLHRVYLSHGHTLSPLQSFQISPKLKTTQF